MDDISKQCMNCERRCPECHTEEFGCEVYAQIKKKSNEIADARYKAVMENPNVVLSMGHKRAREAYLRRNKKGFGRNYFSD